MPRIRIINIYKETHLPEEGWFQGCFICCQITGRTYDFKPEKSFENTRFKVYICPNCSRLKNINEDLAKEYDAHIIRYIERHFT